MDSPPQRWLISIDLVLPENSSQQSSEVWWISFHFKPHPRMESNEGVDSCITTSLRHESLERSLSTTQQRAIVEGRDLVELRTSFIIRGSFRVLGLSKPKKPLFLSRVSTWSSFQAWFVIVASTLRYDSITHRSFNFLGSEKWELDLELPLACGIRHTNALSPLSMM